MRPRIARQWISTTCAAALMLTACDGTAPRGPGSIKVSATSLNREPIALQYGISIDSGAPVTTDVGKGLNFTVSGLAPGKHVVKTTSLPAQCTGAAAKDATLQGDDTAKVAFTIACGRTSGDLTVDVVTFGPNQDLNGYLVLIDQIPRASLSRSGSATIRYLTPGTHSVSLGDVALNCSASAEQSRSIVAGGVATLTFAVTCTTPPVAVVRVVASTSGAETDPDGYLFALDGFAARTPPNGTLTLNPQVGTHTWTIGDVAPNCTLSGPTSGTFTSAAADTVTLAVQASCTAVGMGVVGVVATDPVGDTLPSPPGSLAGAHDIVGVTARYVSGWVILVLRLASPAVAPGTGAIRALYGVIDLDVDENPATGITPFVNFFGGTATQGADYFVSFFIADNASAELIKTTGVGAGSVGRVGTTYDADSVIVKIPLNKLGADDGNMTVTMIVGTSDRPTDYAPNAAVITTHVPGSAIAGAAPVGSLRAAPPLPRAAFVRLSGSDWRPKP